MKVVAHRPDEPLEVEPSVDQRAFKERIYNVWNIIAEAVQTTYREALHADVLIQATGLAYISLVSIIPLVAVSFVIFKTVGGFERLMTIIQPLIVQNLAEGAGEEALLKIQDFVQGVAYVDDRYLTVHVESL